MTPDPIHSSPVNGDSRVAPVDHTAAGELPPAALTMPDTPPGYELLGEIDRGGMGVVYRARQVRLNRQVALKVVQSADPTTLRRFLAEAEAIAAVRHPNVVQVYDSGSHAGRPFLAMELCPDGTLAARLKPGKLTPRLAVELLVKVADGVAARHAAGVVHRDLKPGNVLFDAAGEPKVADFGLAKRSGAGDLTVTRAVIGTPAYMSPEQAGGGTKFVGPPADVWALGAMLYEALAGKRPFDGADELTVLDRVRSASVSSLRSVSREVPNELDLIAHKCLAKEPGERYPSAAELAADLRNWLSGRPISARPAGAVETAVKWVQRNRVLAGATAAVAAAMVAGTWVSAWQALRATTEAQRAKTEAERADSAAADAERQRDIARAETKRAASQAAEAQRQADKAAEKTREAETQAARAGWSAYVSSIALCEREWALGNTGEATRLLIDTQETLRGWEYQYLRQAFLRDRLWLSRPTGGPVIRIAVRPGGRQFAAITGNPTFTELQVVETATGKTLWAKKVEGSDSVNAVCYTPDGKAVVTGGGDRSSHFRMKPPGVPAPPNVRVWDADSGDPLHEILDLAAPVIQLLGHPKEDAVFSLNTTGELSRLEPANWKAERVATTGATYVSAGVAFSPDGSQVAIHQAGREVVVRETRSGDVVYRVPLPWPDARDLSTHYLSFSPDGRLLVAAGAGAVAWDTADKRLVWTIAVNNIPNIKDIGWLFGTGELLFCSENGAVYFLDAKTGAVVRKLQGHTGPVWAMGVAPVAPPVVLTGGGDRTLRGWRTTPTAAPAALRAGSASEWLNAVEFTPDGRRLVSVSHGENRFRVWDVKSRTAVYSRPADCVQAVSVDPTGRKAYSAGGEGRIQVWDLNTGAASGKLDGGLGLTTTVACSPAGGLVAAGCDRGRLVVWDADTGLAVRRPEARQVGVSHVRFSPDGKLLAVVMADGSLDVWDTADWRRRSVPGTAQRGAAVDPIRAFTCAFTTDSKRLVLGGRDCVLRVIDLGTLAQSWEASTAPDPVTSIAMLPGGRQFVSGGGRGTMPGKVKVWNLDSPVYAFTLRGPMREINSVAVSPDGDSVAGCTHADGIVIWSKAEPASAGNETK